MSNLIKTTTIVSLLFLLTPTVSASIISLPGCQDHCGHVSIPYPFGITLNCTHNSNPWFLITCDAVLTPPTPFTTTLSSIYMENSTDLMEILTIDTESSTFKAMNFGSAASIGEANDFVQNSLKTLIQMDMRGSPYSLPGNRNSLVLSGCGGSVFLMNNKSEIIAGCSTLCTNLTTQIISGNRSSTSACYGIGCCQTRVSTSLDYFQMEILTTVLEGSRLEDWIWVALIESEFLERNPVNVTRNSDNSTFPMPDVVPIDLDWVVPDLAISSADYMNSRCEFNANRNGYSCRCKHEYYRGNPYLPNGCQVIKECEKCQNTCITRVAKNNVTAYGCPSRSKKSKVPVAIGLVTSLGTLILCILLFGLDKLLKQRKVIRKKKKNNFKRNGGILLHQQLSTGKEAVERTKLFTSDELERATDNFNENRILCRGGQGTVYKGMLVDGTIVAIKKSMKVDENQLGQFINEVVILSQVNHRNVVKLFGCCLETDVPLLVYEFVPNGTLFQQIHKPSEDFRITWKMRLEIAVQSAEAVAYLHSSSHTPIYHRDIKTPNILLDDKYRAKVSDFGTSKTIAIDQTHVSTCVQGTFGYIDPEFFQSNQFTEKSDVYSFGIVLVELLTSMKAVHTDTSSDCRSLASYFLQAMQKSRLFEIIDGKVVEEARKEELEGVAYLAQCCLKLNGKHRPTMKEVATKLVMLNRHYCHNGIDLNTSLKKKHSEERDFAGNYSDMELPECSFTTYVS